MHDSVHLSMVLNDESSRARAVCINNIRSLTRSFCFLYRRWLRASDRAGIQRSCEVSSHDA